MKPFLRTFLAALLVLVGLTLILGAGVFAADTALEGSLAANPIYLPAGAPGLALNLVDPAALAAAVGETAVQAQAVPPETGRSANPPTPVPPQAVASGEAAPISPPPALPTAQTPTLAAAPTTAENTALPSAEPSPAASSNAEPSAVTPTLVAAVENTAGPTPVAPSSANPIVAQTPAAPTASAAAEPSTGQGTPDGAAKTLPTPFQPGSTGTTPTLPPEFIESLLAALPANLFPPTATPQPPEFFYPNVTQTAQPAPNSPGGEAPGSAAPPIESAPANPVPVYTPSEPIVRISIPRLRVKRAVVDIGITANGQDWDTDSLFATRSRPDLVGHLEGSALPGEAGNTVLVGHNYDYIGPGVFVNLGDLRAGDEIKLVTEGGQEFIYQVAKVKIVPYSGAQGIERHQRFLDPRGEERLTLVTCGGVNIGFFNKRVYVVAYPAAN